MKQQDRPGCDHENMEPVTPQEFMETALQDVEVILVARDPRWRKTFRNLIEIAESLAFRRGFFAGMFLTALLVVVFFLVTRR